jgi:uncharacterized membrane protein (UPF0127 family)
MTAGWRLVRRDTGAVVVEDLEVAAGFWSRFVGLQFRAKLAPNAGLLLVPCSSIHTCFVRFPIDVVFLDERGVVLAVRPHVCPWRVVFAPRGTRAVLELFTGSATEKFQAGVSLQLRPLDGRSQTCPTVTAFLG